MKKCVFILAFLVIWLPLWAVGDATENEVIARGDGFVVTQKDVEALREKLHIPPFVSPKVLKKKVVYIKLFAMEARKVGVAGQKDDDFEAAAKYKVWILRNYTVPDDAIESYYLSHYKEYESDNGTLMPLTDEERDRIRAKLLAAARRVIIEREIEKLKAKYHVVFLNGGEQKHEK